MSGCAASSGTSPDSAARRTAAEKAWSRSVSRARAAAPLGRLGEDESGAASARRQQAALVGRDRAGLDDDRQDADPVREVRLGAPQDRFLGGHAREEDLLRLEQERDRGDQHGEASRELLDDRDRALVAARREVEDLVRCQVGGQARVPRGRRERRGADALRAERAAWLRHERDLAGTAGRAAVELAVDDDPGADPDPEAQQDERAQVLARPRALLGDRGEVDVVLEQDGAAEAVLEGGVQRGSTLLEAGDAAHHGVVEVHDRGEPDDGAPDRDGRGPRVVAHRGDAVGGELLDDVRAGRGVLGRERLLGAGTHPSDEVDQRDPDADVADVDRERVPVLRVDPVERGRRAAALVVEARLLDDALLDERAQRVGHGGLGQARGRDDLGSAERVVGVEHIEDGPGVDLPEQSLVSCKKHVYRSPLTVVPLGHE